MEQQFIYLEKWPGTSRFNFRGVAGENDNPAGFATQMGKKGHKVAVTPDFRGAEVTANDLIGFLVDVAVTPAQLPEQPEFTPAKLSLFKRIIGSY